MSVTFIRGDITKLKVDAIVNAANNELRGGGGVDGAIHAASGAEQLHAFCKTLGGCPTGEAKLSPGFNLPAKYIIHTVGPVWRGGNYHEKTLLSSCYIRSLELAQQHKCKTVAFPLISAGAYGYPYEDALQIAYDTCQRFLHETKADMEVFIVLYQRARNYNANVIRRHTAYSGCPDADAFQSVANYISEHYHFDAEDSAMSSAPAMASAQPIAKEKRAASSMLRRWFNEECQTSKKLPKQEDFPVEETFTQMLIRFMNNKNLTPPEVYTPACIDRKLFSKIISNIHYQPNKNTAVKLALGLQLSSDETDKLLNAAGFALSRSKITDLVISYCISHNQRTVWQVNGILEDYGLAAI